MLTPEQVADLIDRLTKAHAELKALATTRAPVGTDKRLAGKASGVALALSYINEYLR
jgi:hypothetical protein